MGHEDKKLITIMQVPQFHKHYRPHCLYELGKDDLASSWHCTVLDTQDRLKGLGHDFQPCDPATNKYESRLKV